MLDVMRKHASSIVIKFIMGAIIISFIFFFGYSSYNKGMRGGRMGGDNLQMVAKVNGTPVSDAEYEFYLKNKLEQIKASFKDQEMPDFAKKLAQSSALSEIVGREIALQLADELGLVITDTELADVIKKSQMAQMGGEFDPIEYRYKFLPYFLNSFGLDYEQFVRQDLRIQTLGSLFRDVDTQTPFADYNLDELKTTWTFESVTLDTNALVASKAVKTAEEVEEHAKKIAAAKPAEWQTLLRPLKVTPAKIGPISTSERRQLLDGNGTEEDFIAIFSLTRERPAIDVPIARGGKFYIVRLTEKAQKSDAKPAVIDNYFQAWMTRLIAEAKVQNYLEKQ